MRAPDDLTAFAIETIWSRLSTEHGPLIKTISLPPTGTPPMATGVRVPRNSCATSLYGLRTGVTDSTPGMAAIGFSRMTSSGPMTPITTRIAPRLTSARNPQSLIRSTMCSICASVASGRVTIIIKGRKNTGRTGFGNFFSLRGRSLSHNCYISPIDLPNGPS